MIIFVPLFLVGQLFFLYTNAFIETVNIKGFYNEEFLLTCKINSQIAIIKGVFRSFYNLRINIRSILNKRCSGLNHCSFIFTKDFAGAEQYRIGIIYIQFYCISKTHIVKHCNRNFMISNENESQKEGFLANPGYPHLYLLNRNCSWTVQVANPLQTLRISVLDVSLRDNYCYNTLSIIENDQSIFDTCESIEDQFSYETKERISIDFISESTDSWADRKSTNLQIVPKRGFLIHYKVIGCVLSQLPQNGYLVSYENYTALYMCYVHHVFSDTRSRTKSIRCINENMWQQKLPDCVHKNTILRRWMKKRLQYKDSIPNSTF